MRRGHIIMTFLLVLSKDIVKDFKIPKVKLKIK